MNCPADPLLIDFLSLIRRGGSRLQPGGRVIYQRTPVVSSLLCPHHSLHLPLVELNTRAVQFGPIAKYGRTVRWYCSPAAV